jgi:tRNA-dihydrouridine synthase A
MSLTPCFDSLSPPCASRFAVVCVLQLGGSDPELLRQAAKAAAAYGYDELNLNCGCPSDRVAGAGCFGASLMLEPQLVADCMAALRAGAAEGGSAARISVKCR